MNQLKNDLDIEPWYKQGWPWALIAIPFFTVIAGVITFMYAYYTDDSLVDDDYYKVGLAINKNIDRINHAAQLGISAEIEHAKKSNLILVSMKSNGKLPNKLILKLTHPTLKSKDHLLTLSLLSGNQYAAELNMLAATYWHVSIEDDSKTWLLKSRWLYPEKTKLIIQAEKM